MSRALLALGALVMSAAVAGCGDPDGPARRGLSATPGAAPATPADDPLAAPAPAPAQQRSEAAPRPYEELRTAPIEVVVMTLRASPDSTARRHAADVYATRVTQGASPEPLLEACAADLDPVVRRWAALGLAAAAPPEMAPRLSALAASEPDATVRSILERAARESEAKRGAP